MKSIMGSFGCQATQHLVSTDCSHLKEIAACRASADNLLSTVLRHPCVYAVISERGREDADMDPTGHDRVVFAG
jgi:hypothetical protein